jgi:hypothetical protein
VCIVTSPTSSSRLVSWIGVKETLICVEGCNLKVDRNCRYCGLRYVQVFLRNWSSSSETVMLASSILNDQLGTPVYGTGLNTVYLDL